MPNTIYSQDYNNQDYNPSMPVITIGVSKPGGKTAAATLEAIIDTGADGTLIPLNILTAAGAKLIDSAHLRGITGHREPVALYLATIHIGPIQIHGVRVAAMLPDDEAILGRDVLNKLEILLNGYAGVTEVMR